MRMKELKFNVAQLVILGVGGAVGIIGSIFFGTKKKKPIRIGGLWACPHCNILLDKANYKELYCNKCKRFFLNVDSPYYYGEYERRGK